LRPTLREPRLVGLLISLIGLGARAPGFGVRGSGPKAQGLQLIFNLDEAPVVWSDPALDITADVVKLLAQR
jgi:hypothetical protein